MVPINLQLQYGHSTIILCVMYYAFLNSFFKISFQCYLHIKSRVIKIKTLIDMTNYLSLRVTISSEDAQFS